MESEIVTANVTKSGNIVSFTIPAQKPNGQFTVSGSGQFNIATKKITIKYGFSWLGSEPDGHSGIWTLQP